MSDFPHGYLVMGKNVFSWINDMFIRKEVTTLSEALPVPTLHSFLATKREKARLRVRNNRDNQEKEVSLSLSPDHLYCVSISP